MMQFPKARPYGSSSGGGGGGNGGIRAGVCRNVGRAVADAGGEFNPLGLTFMWSLQGARNEPDRYRANLEWAAERFDFKRPLYEVDWDDPLKIDPATFPDHLGAIARDLDLSWGVLKLRSGITLSGKGTGYDLERLARDVGDVIATNGREAAVLAVEMQNEWDNGGDPVEVLERMARAIRPKIPNMIGLSRFGAPEGTGDEIHAAAKAWRARIEAVGGVLMIRHTERNPADHGWRDVRQAYDFSTDRPLVGADWEGPGPGSSGSVLTDPLRLAMKRALAVLCGAPIFILHTGTGVFGNGQPSGSGAPRPPNFWEIENIDQIVGALRGIDQLLPAGLPNWTVANTQWEHPLPVAPFQPHHHWEGDHGTGVNKAYAALAPDGRVIQMPIGVRDHVTLTASYPLADVVVYDPISLARVRSVASIDKGQTIELPGGLTVEADAAYIIHGRRL